MWCGVLCVASVYSVVVQRVYTSTCTHMRLIYVRVVYARLRVHGSRRVVWMEERMTGAATVVVVVVVGDVVARATSKARKVAWSSECAPRIA